MPIKVLIVGYGNVGKMALQALRQAKDMKLVGLASGSLSQKDKVPAELEGVSIKARPEDFKGEADVAILCVPSRSVPEFAERCLALGMNTVDSFDIHTDILDTKRKLDAAAKAAGRTAVLSAGWDPGSDSVVRTLMMAMLPRGLSYTNFGPGMSMGHTVAVKAIEGVKNALSMTMPQGDGIHKRMVYVELESGAALEDVTSRIKADPYFVHDETHVIEVEDVAEVKDVGHGVHLVRQGSSGATHNQYVEFNMRINNPALTSQIMISCARACLRQEPGCYTMIEIPPVDYLPGDRDGWVKKLV